MREGGGFVAFHIDPQEVPDLACGSLSIATKIFWRA
jgi:hypothetical protein